MRRMIAPVLAAAAGALALAGAAPAATVTIQVKRNAFSPGNVTVNHGDQVTFHNADTIDHQVVANNGSFASPILHRGQSWTHPLSTAGTFGYHDALHPNLTGKITVKGPPPSVSLALSAPVVLFGTPTTLTGTISNQAANETVELDAQPYGQASATVLAMVKTGAGGAFSYSFTPAIYTTYTARWGKVGSSSVVVQVAPKMRLVPGSNGYMKAMISSPVSLWHRHVTLQRLSKFGQWVAIANLTLGQQNGRLFQPTHYLPKGSSKIRVFLSVNQAGVGLLSSHSGTQLINRRR